MAIEIERKFLSRRKSLFLRPIYILKCFKRIYVLNLKETIRVRISDDRAFLTIKGAMSGISRCEFEYEIPEKDARELLKLAVSNPVEKVRKIIYVDGKKWEVDFFGGVNSGLVLAEIELENADERVILPKWVEKEVSGDKRYYNSQLSQHPYSEWR